MCRLKKAVDSEYHMVGMDICSIILKPIAIMEKPIIKRQVEEQGQNVII